MSDEILKLAEQSRSTDLGFALKAKEEAKKRMKENPSSENIAAFRKAREMLQEEMNRTAGAASGRVFRTQLDAAAFLRDSGYKVSKSQFKRDVQARKIPRNPEGHFEEAALLGYAAAHLAPAGQLADSALIAAASDQKSADAELKKYQAARQRLKFEKEQGLLMPRADHERELGARALFFKNEVRNFIHLHGAAIIHLTGGDEAKLRELVSWWENKTAVWMDAWAADRSFCLPDGDDPASSADDADL